MVVNTYENGANLQAGSSLNNCYTGTRTIHNIIERFLMRGLSYNGRKMAESEKTIGTSEEFQRQLDNLFELNAPSFRTPEAEDLDLAAALATMNDGDLSVLDHVPDTAKEVKNIASVAQVDSVAALASEYIQNAFSKRNIPIEAAASLANASIARIRSLLIESDRSLGTQDSLLDVQNRDSVNSFYNQGS